MSTDPLTSIDWPENPTVESLADSIGGTCGLRIVLAPIPCHLCQPEVSGMTVTVGTTARVYYDAGQSPINQLQTIMHEYAHILHGDVCAGELTICRRTTFDDPREQRAEITGMQLMLEIQRRSQQSDLMDFFSGDPKVT